MGFLHLNKIGPQTALDNTNMSSFSYQPETTAYLNAISISNDSTVYFSGTPQQATGEDIWLLVDNVVIGIKNNVGLSLGTNNLSNQFKCIYPRIGDTVTQFRYNLVTATPDATYFGGWTFEASGATPNGTNAYVDLGLSYNTANFINNNQSFGFLSKVNNLSGLFAEFGSINNGYSDVTIYTNSAPLTSRLNSQNNLSVTLSNSLGLLSMSRISSTEYKVYQNGSLIATQIDNSTPLYIPPFGGKIVEAAVFNNGSSSVIFYSPRKRTWFFAGQGMTPTQMADVVTTLQTFETAFNR